MPIYEYKCENEHVFDVMQRMSENPLAECIECGAPVRKLLQPVGISFKGSGFYSTDYNKKGPKPDSKEKVESGSGASGGDAGGANGDKKPQKETAKAETSKAETPKKD